MSIKSLRKHLPIIQQVRNQISCAYYKPRHLICFKQWTADMIMDVIRSAKRLKCCHRNTHCKKLATLANAKIMILQEVNEPILNLAVSKAASLLGADDVSIQDHVAWEYDYNGSIFGFMSDAIFVSTTTHMCVQRLADKSPVPVMCMRSRTHATIQSLATVMTILEQFGTMKNVNVSWVGAPHPILNSYLLLCPMLGANIRFKCCCKDNSVSPLLLNVSEEMVKGSSKVVAECTDIAQCIQDGHVYISGPTCAKKDKVDEFGLTVDEPSSLFKCLQFRCKSSLNSLSLLANCFKSICDATRQNWIYFHTCPRGEEVDDVLFYHRNSLTFCAFENMHFIAAALMAYCIKGFTF